MPESSGIVDILYKIVLYAFPILMAITVHEAAHGYVARLLGDNTAQEQGRVTLNPIKHIDPVGTIVLPLVMFLSTTVAMGSGMIFGWAKPVPVTYSRLRNPKQDMFWVALAGPASNLLMMVLWVLLIRFTITDTGPSSIALYDMAMMGIRINAILMALNLLPIPPLDGSRMVTSILPTRWAIAYNRIEPYGFFILIILMVSGYLLPILQPLLGIADAVIKALL